MRQSAVPRDWWKTFFGTEAARMMFDDRRWRAAAPEAELVIRRAGLKPGMRVLDMACGPGRHVLEFAKRGLLVTGLDYSREYVAGARRRIRAAGLDAKARIVREDMRRLDRVIAPGTFDAVVSLFNSFGYFRKSEDDRLVLRQVARVLKPGGVFVLNTLNRPGVIYRLETLPRTTHHHGVARWSEPRPGRLELEGATWNAREGRTESQWIVVDVRRRRITRLAFGQHAYSHEEFRRWLRPLGLRVIRRWGLMNGSPFTARSWHQTFVARKTSEDRR